MKLFRIGIRLMASKAPLCSSDIFQSLIIPHLSFFVFCFHVYLFHKLLKDTQHHYFWTVMYKADNSHL